MRFLVHFIHDFVGFFAGFFTYAVYDAARCAGAGYAELIAGEKTYDDQDRGKPPGEEEEQNQGNEGNFDHDLVFVADFQMAAFSLLDERADPF